MNKKIILAILGSPHKNGITATMLNHAVHQAEGKGYIVETINLYEKNIAFCIGCRTCIHTKNCIQKDDIQEIVRLINECEIVFLAAPVYWANVPAPVKNLFDRLLGTAIGEANPLPEARLNGKKYMLFTSCNTPAPFSWIFGQSRGISRNVDEFFRLAGMKRIGKFVCSNSANRKELPHSLIRNIEKTLKAKI